MSDEDFRHGEGRIQIPNGDDVEEMLEILMKIVSLKDANFWRICRHGSHGSCSEPSPPTVSFALVGTISLPPMTAWPDG